MNPDRFLSWVEINRQALTNNVRRFKAHIGPEVKLAAVLKANAYGHGMVEASRVALEAGADWLAVNSIEEAALRDAGLQLPSSAWPMFPFLLEEAVALDARLTVFNRETVDRLGHQVGCTAGTCTSRSRPGQIGRGCAADLLRLARPSANIRYLVLEGLSTHYANIEDVTEHGFAEFQLDNFRDACSLLEQNGISVPVRHTACTAAAILFPKTLFNLARVGIGLYGLWPSKETRISALQAGIALNRAGAGPDLENADRADQDGAAGSNHRLRLH